MVTGHIRGNPIEHIDDKWVYSDNKIPIEMEERPCPRCGRMPTPEGYDACLGYIPGATSACCGHGIAGDKILIFASNTSTIMKKDILVSNY